MQHNDFFSFFGRAPEIDISELESLFSVASISDGANKGAGPRGSKINKPEKVQLASDILNIHCVYCNFCMSILKYYCMHGHILLCFLGYLK